MVMFGKQMGSFQFTKQALKIRREGIILSAGVTHVVVYNLHNCVWFMQQNFAPILELYVQETKLHKYVNMFIYM